MAIDASFVISFRWKNRRLQNLPRQGGRLHYGHFEAVIAACCQITPNQ
jgi:hypothetical protein